MIDIVNKTLDLNNIKPINRDAIRIFCSAEEIYEISKDLKLKINSIEKFYKNNLIKFYNIKNIEEQVLKILKVNNLPIFDPSGDLDVILLILDNIRIKLIYFPDIEYYILLSSDNKILQFSRELIL